MLIEKDITRGVMLFSGEVKERLILTPTVAAAAFKVQWKDDRAKLGNILASVTGMRAGEIMALQVQDSRQLRARGKGSEPASFFKTLKRELETLEGTHSASEVRQSVFMYVEAYYNRLRLHSALDYVVSPCPFCTSRSIGTLFLLRQKRRRWTANKIFLNVFFIQPPFVPKSPLSSSYFLCLNLESP
jgi:hypothetical protein